MTRRGEPAGEPEAPTPESSTLLDRLWWTPLLVAAVPLGLGLALLAQHTWYPVGDFGQANMRLLSFWSNPPLVGAAGRIVGPEGVQGNHPGPSIFWMAWPLWRLLGASSWAVNAAVALTNLAGAAVAVLCGRRLGGPRVAWAVGAVVVLLVAGFGPEVMLMPWNPSMPLMWFLALVVATWGVLVGHRGMLVVVAGTASHVVQAHAGYAPVAIVLCGLAAVVAGRDAWRTRAAGGIRMLLPWVGGAVALTALLWVPPLVDQLVSDPGNLTILRYSFGHPDEDYVGPGSALRLVLLQLDPTGGLLRGAEPTTGVPVGGVALVGIWIASGAWARPLTRTWIALDAVLAAALAAAWFSVSRIFGSAFVYLFRWTWPLCGLLLVATGAHLVAGLRARRSPLLDRPLVPVAIALALALGVGSGLVRFSGTEVSGEPYSDTIAGLVEPTGAELDPDAAYLVRWDDPIALGAVGFGMVLELDRRGFDVGVDERFSAAAEPGRVLDEADADAVLWVASGRQPIARIAERPGARVVAETDVRTPAEQERYDMLEERVAGRLAEEGYETEADAVRAGGNVTVILFANPELPDDVTADITEMVGLFLPTAVILTPPDTGT